MTGETRSNPGFGAVMGIVSGLAIVFMISSGRSKPEENTTRSMVECFSSGCYPKPSARLSELEGDALVLKYARDNRCEEMHGRANLACNNVSPR